MAKSRRQLVPILAVPADLWSRLLRVARAEGLSPLAGAPLAAAVTAVSRLYTGERSRIEEHAIDVDALAARLLFFLVRDFSKVTGPLEELWAQGFGRSVDGPLRVLDVGAGVGASGLGVARFAAEKGMSSVDLIALDREPAVLRVARGLFEELGTMGDWLAPLRVHTHVAAAEAALPEGPFDLIVASFVLNEILLGFPKDERARHGARLLRHFCQRLAPGGALVVLEPALKQTSRTLSAVRDEFAASPGPPYVCFPCLHSAPCPMLAGERDWCHQVRPRALPAPWDGLARAAGLRFEGLSYAYLTLRAEPPTWPVLAEGARRLRVVSDGLGTKGKHECFGCGDGELVRVTRLDREHSVENRLFAELQRGEVCELTGSQRTPRGLRVRSDTHVKLVQSPHRGNAG